MFRYSPRFHCFTLALLVLLSPWSVCSATVEPGTQRWELQGDGSLLNHLKKVEPGPKHGHRYKALRPTPSYNRNAEVLMIDTAYVLRARGIVEGEWEGRTGKWLVFMVPDQRVIYREAERIVFFDDLVDHEQAYQDGVLQEKAADLERDKVYFREKVLPVIIERVVAILVFIAIIIVFARIRRARIKAAKAIFDAVPPDWNLRIDRVVPYQMRKTTYYQSGYTGDVQNGRVVNVRPRMLRSFTEGNGLFVEGRWRGQDPAAHITLSFGAYDHLGRKEATAQEHAGTGRIRPAEYFAIDFIPQDQHATQQLESVAVQDERSGRWMVIKPMRSVPRPNELLTRVAKVTLLPAFAIFYPLFLVRFDLDRLDMNWADFLSLIMFITATIMGLLNITAFWVVGIACLFALGTDHPIMFLTLGGLWMGIVWNRRKSFTDFMRAQDSRD